MRAALRRDVDCDRRILGQNRHSTIENHRLGISLPEIYLKDIPYCTSVLFFQNKLSFQLDHFTFEHCGHCAREARRRDVDRDQRVLGQNRHSIQQFEISKVQDLGVTGNIPNLLPTWTTAKLLSSSLLRRSLSPTVGALALISRPITGPKARVSTLHSFSFRSFVWQGHVAGLLTE